MFKKIKIKIASLKASLASRNFAGENITSVVSNLPVAESARESAVRKRVREAIEQGHQILMVRGLKSHSCVDPIACNRVTCFKFEPDKIQKTLVIMDVDQEAFNADQKDMQVQLTRQKKLQLRNKKQKLSE